MAATYSFTFTDLAPLGGAGGQFVVTSDSAGEVLRIVATLDAEVTATTAQNIRLDEADALYAACLAEIATWEQTSRDAESTYKPGATAFAALKARLAYADRIKAECTKVFA